MDTITRKLGVGVILLLLASQTWAAEIRQEPTQDPSAPYSLFSTQNIYTFLKLDTRAGRIWQVQWGDSDHRFETPLNLKPLASKGSPGRFTLYPTGNVYTFMLLDQETGDTWYVQWGKPENRFVIPID